MDKVDEVNNIIHQNITNNEKVHLLEELLIDLKNEMEAQDQNMQPEMKTRLSEAYQLANQYLLDKTFDK